MAFQRVKFSFPIWLFMAAALTGTAQDTLFYNGEAERKIGHRTVSYLASSDSILTLAQAKAHIDQKHFIVNEKPDLNLGIAKENYWVTFTLINVTTWASEVYLNLENPRLNEVDVYVLADDSLLSVLRLGDNFPFRDRAIQYAQFAFPLVLQPQKAMRVFLFVKHKGNTLQLPMSLLGRDAFLAKVEADYLFLGTLTGIFLITFFFGLFFLINTRDLLFVYYSGYIFTACAWLWTTEGFAFQYLWPQLPELATRLGPGISAVSACFFLANCLQFCKPYDATSHYRKALIWTLFFLIVWSSTPFLPFVAISEKTMAVYLSVYFSTNILLCFFLVLYLSWLSRRQRIVLYYLMAVIVTIVCSVTVVMRGAGAINIPFQTSTIMSLGYVLELVLMTAGITKQFYNYRKEKEEALLANVQQQRSINTKIVQTQNEERNRISRELHDDIGPRITQITMMSETAKRAMPDGSPAFKELDEITIASRHLVANMGEIVWSLNPDNMRSRDLLSYLREQLHQLLAYSGMEYEIVFDVVDDRAITHSQLRNLLLVTKEIVHNAVKHSGAKKIMVRGTPDAKGFHFIISDDGKGFDLTKPSAGNGMRNIRQRINEIGGQLNIDTQPGRGATFSYSVPL